MLNEGEGGGAGAYSRDSHHDQHISLYIFYPYSFPQLSKYRLVPACSPYRSSCAPPHPHPAQMIYDGLWDPYNDQHMGMCGEKCASDYKFTREQQDAFAVGRYAPPSVFVGPGRPWPAPVGLLSARIRS
jgi:hypothetical protein